MDIYPRIIIIFHNICFHVEIRKISIPLDWKKDLSRTLHSSNSLQKKGKIRDICRGYVSCGEKKKNIYLDTSLIWWSVYKPVLCFEYLTIYYVKKCYAGNRLRRKTYKIMHLVFCYLSTVRMTRFPCWHTTWSEHVRTMESAESRRVWWSQWYAIFIHQPYGVVAMPWMDNLLKHSFCLMDIYNGNINKESYLLKYSI